MVPALHGRNDLPGRGLRRPPRAAAVGARPEPARPVGRADLPRRRAPRAGASMRPQAPSTTSHSRAPIHPPTPGTAVGPAHGPPPTWAHQRAPRHPAQPATRARPSGVLVHARRYSLWAEQWADANHVQHTDTPAASVAAPVAAAAVRASKEARLKKWRTAKITMPKAFSLLPVQSLGRPVVHFEATALRAFFGWVSKEVGRLGDADGPFEENRYDGVNDECADTARRFRALLDVGPQLQTVLKKATKAYTAHCAEHGLTEDLDPLSPHSLPGAGVRPRARLARPAPPRPRPRRGAPRAGRAARRASSARRPTRPPPAAPSDPPGRGGKPAPPPLELRVTAPVQANHLEVGDVALSSVEVLRQGDRAPEAEAARLGRAPCRRGWPRAMPRGKPRVARLDPRWGGHPPPETARGPLGPTVGEPPPPRKPRVARSAAAGPSRPPKGHPWRTTEPATVPGAPASPSGPVEAGPLPQGRPARPPAGPYRLAPLSGEARRSARGGGRPRRPRLRSPVVATHGGAGHGAGCTGCGRGCARGRAAHPPLARGHPPAPARAVACHAGRVRAGTWIRVGASQHVRPLRRV